MAENCEMSECTTIKPQTLIGATLLIAGCCIGAAMIGLPVVSALAGFIPSTLAMILCYLFTTITGLLLVEATLWFDESVNLPTIMEFAFGKVGKTLTIILFLFLFYCLFVAYLDAGGSLFAGILQAIVPIAIPHSIGVLTCMAFVFIITYAGTIIVDGINRAMMVGLGISYIVLAAIGVPNVNHDNLFYTSWTSTLGVIPVMLICFGYHNLVPSITYYLKKNVNAIRFAIIIGNLIPFVIYFLWEYLILGILPIDQINNANESQIVVDLLQQVSIPTISVMFFVKSFSMFAMLTSFLPNTISFVDFLKDGFKKQFNNQVRHNLLIYAFVLIPPTLCTLIYPKLFLHAISFAGGFIDVILFGVLPALLILLGRRIRKTPSAYQVAGGIMTPIIILMLSGAVLVLKLMGKM